MEVQISTIHHVEAARFGHQQVQGVHIVHLPIADVDEAGNGTTQVHQGVHLHGRLCGAEQGPREGGQTQIDRGGIQGIDRLLHIQHTGFQCVQLARLSDQNLGELRVHPPIAQFVGIGQGGAPHCGPEAHAVELCGLCGHARLDVPQALPIGELGEGHHPEMFRAVQRPHVVVPSVTVHDPFEGGPWQMVHELGKKCAARVHRHVLELTSKTTPEPLGPHSNRPHAISSYNLCYC